MTRLTVPLTAVVALMFAYAPFMILDAPFEQSMGVVSKIFYFHAACGMILFVAAFSSGVGSARYLFTRNPAHDRMAVAGAELTVVFGLIVLVTGPLWARKAWGVWWVWDPRLTSTLVMWMIFTAYLLLRKYGGPGSERLAAAAGWIALSRHALAQRGRVNVQSSANERVSPATSCRTGAAAPSPFSRAATRTVISS